MHNSKCHLHKVTVEKIIMKIIIAVIIVISKVGIITRMMQDFVDTVENRDITLRTVENLHIIIARGIIVSVRKIHGMSRETCGAPRGRAPLAESCQRVQLIRLSRMSSSPR